MAKAKFDIAAFDFKGEAQRSLHAGVGAADLAIEAVKDYVAEAQKRFEGYQKDAQKALTSAQQSVKGFDLEPKALRTQATTVLNARVEELSKDAKARRTAVEKRVAELQADAQKVVTTSVETATGTFESLAKRGEKVVKRIRKETSSAVDPGPVKKSTGTTTTAKKAPVKKTPAVKKTTTVRKTTSAKKAPATKKATAGK
jgi:F0F1-type ATP synthase membrane subunit b/b'